MKKKFMIMVLLAVTMMTTSCVQKVGKTIAQNIMSGAEIQESAEQETGDEDRLKDQLYEEIASETNGDEELVTEHDDGDTIHIPEESSLPVNPVMSEGAGQTPEDLKDSNEPDSENDFKALTHTEDAYAAYEMILDEYRSACAVGSQDYFADSEKYETMYPDVNPFELYEYHVPDHENPFDGSTYEKHELMYTYYDIDQNGTPELLIFESAQKLAICDLYTFDGISAVKAFPEIILLDNRSGELTSVSLYESGAICFTSGDSTLYRLSTDGHSLDPISWEEWDWNAENQITFDKDDLEMLAEDIPSEETSPKESQMAERNSYSSIIEEYREACSIEDEEYKSNTTYYTELYSNVAAMCMTYYHLYKDNNFYYVYYDINHDGQDELLIGYGSEVYFSLVDVYTCKGTEAMKAVDSSSLGDRSKLTICSDGTLIYHASGGMADEYNFLKIDQDGYSVITELSYTGDWQANPETPYYDGYQYLSADDMENIINSYSEIDVSTLEWILLF